MILDHLGLPPRGWADGARGDGACMRGADSGGADMRGADRGGACVRGADTEGADRVGADILGGGLVVRFAGGILLYCSARLSP